MKTSQYDNYFVDHYKSKLSSEDIKIYKKWFQAQWKRINSLISISPNDRVLEIGSGFGGFYSFLQEAGVKRYKGIELDSSVTEFANKHYKKKVFHTTSIEDLSGKEKYDKIFAFEVLEHIENPSQVIEKIHQHLKKGGIFCGTTPYPYRKNILADETHVSVLHPDNWQRLFELSGMELVTLQPMSFLPVLWRKFPALNKILPFYVPTPGFISTTLIVAKRKD